MDVTEKIQIKLEKILNRLKVLKVIQTFKLEISFCQMEDGLKQNLIEIDSILKKCLRKIIAKPRKAEIRNVITELVRRKNLNMSPNTEDEKIIREECANAELEVKKNSKPCATEVVKSNTASHLRKEDNEPLKNVVTNKKAQRKLKSYLCELCGIKFHNIQRWKFHNDRHLEEKKFEEKCFAWYPPKLKTIEDHLEEDEVINPPLFIPQMRRKGGSFTCCGVSFRTKTLLKEHKAKEHQKEVGDSENHAPHTQDSKFTCQCGKTFRLLKTLRKHESLKHSVISIVHNCAVCKKPFMEKGKLNRHMLSHQTGQHQCRFCLKQFARSDALKRHLSIAHYPEKNFSCSFCGKKFNLKYNKDVHEENVHKRKENDIECEKCGQKYKNKLTLKSHLKIHTEKRIICNICGKPFSRKIHFKNHMKTKHADVSFSHPLGSAAPGELQVGKS